MPIKGLSDRDSVDPRFKEIGRLRKGASKTGNRPGADLDYFRFVPDNGRQDIAQAFKVAYGEQPERLTVYFPFPRMEQVFSSYREAYGQNRLCKLRCDGENWIDWIEDDKHYHSERGRPCDFKFKDVANKCPDCPCGYYGRLKVVLPELLYAGHIGIVLVMTTSINDIANLSAKLVQWEPLIKKPFTLWRAPERIGVPIKGKRAAVEKSLLHLELQEDEMVRLLLGTKEDVPALPEPDREPDNVIIVGDGQDEPPPDLDYDGELIEGDEFLEEKRDEEEVLPPFLIPPEENDWTTFFKRAVDELGYDNPAHASKVKDRLWSNDPQPTWADLWAYMVEHQAEKGLVG